MYSPGRTRMNRTWFFRPVTITLLSRANAAALPSARCVPPSLRADARLRMSRSVPLLSAGTAGSSREVNSSSQCWYSRFQIRTQSGCCDRVFLIVAWPARWGQPTHFHFAQRASVGSTEAAKDVVARVGRIDRSIGEPPCARRCRRTDARNSAEEMAARKRRMRIRFKSCRPDWHFVSARSYQPAVARAVGRHAVWPAGGLARASLVPQELGSQGRRGRLGQAAPVQRDLSAGIPHLSAQVMPAQRHELLARQEAQPEEERHRRLLQVLRLPG